jgi:RNA polymerase sigma-70 factor (ECF subfamily)
VFAQTTHISLLERLSDGRDAVAWHEFCTRYGDLIRNFARHQNLQQADIDDVLQDVLMALTKAMPGFVYDPSKGKFRSYLKTVTLHAIFARSRQKRGEVALEDVKTAADAAAADATVDGVWDEQWRQYHLRQAMRTIESEFNDLDIAAFKQYGVAGRGAKEVADELGVSVDSVYQAKSRILKRLGSIIEQQVGEEG